MKALKIILLILFCTSSQIYSNDISHAAKKAKESVILITVFSSKLINGKIVYSKTGYGSGTIISSKGHVVTNYHVVKKGDYYIATLSDGTETEFEQLESNDYFRYDSETDLALMRLKPGGYIPIELADSSNSSEGETVIAVGNPYGLRHSITSGIISSMGRCDIGFSAVEDFIQTDVPINPGNSGGPLINLKGQMIGINSAIRTSNGSFQGISFAIPSYIVKKVAEDLLTYKRVRRGWIGILVKEEFEDDKRNVKIISITSGSPAQKAGLKKGDIIKEADGTLINSKGSLIRIIKNKDIDTELFLTISRKGILLDKKLFFSENITETNGSYDRIRQKYGFSVSKDSDGLAVISDVSSFSKIESLEVGDSILAVNGKKTPDMTTFLKRIRSNSYRINSVLIKRGSEHYFFKSED
ncbi:MAG: trypsin-like peptidase domain-containing protein [Spirochaetes bacterium]|nr:trypsin-like peptidase domain-containing protein [Spirochaetota bacterium]